MLTRDIAVRQLRQLGLAPGSTVMVHASLRALGPIEGRASGLIDAMRCALGPQGTMMMVLGADADEPFDAATTPVDTEDMGFLAEIFRQSEARVNDHAAARYGACGPSAAALIDDPPLHDYHGPGSPLERLAETGGFVLRLGADIDTLTLTHLAEYRARINNKRRVKRRYVRADLGEQWIESLDDDDGIIEGDDGAYFGRILVDYLAGPNARIGNVGLCTAELIDAGAFVEYATRWLEGRFVLGGGDHSKPLRER